MLSQASSLYGRLEPSNHYAEKALRDQEPLIKSHIDLLISQLCNQIDGSTKGVVNIVSGLIPKPPTTC